MINRNYKHLEETIANGVCHECKVELEFDISESDDTENWFCSVCAKEYIVPYNIVRDWSNMEEIE